MENKYCACCGKEINDQGMTLSVPCHYLTSADFIGSYVDMAGNRVCEEYETVNVCNKCSNKIFSSAMSKFNEIKAGL